MKESKPGLDQDKTAVFILKDETKKESTIPLWSNNFLSNWFFIWVLPILFKSRTAQNPRDYKFSLRAQETAKVNVDALDKAWDDQLKSG
jgi:hypothetical protein